MRGPSPRYRPVGANAVQASITAAGYAPAGDEPFGGTAAIMQADGNFVLYTSSGAPVWASNTAGNAGAYLDVQNARDPASGFVHLRSPWSLLTFVHCICLIWVEMVESVL
jgi:hypothetical protein